MFLILNISPSWNLKGNVIHGGLAISFKFKSCLFIKSQNTDLC